MKKIHIMVYTSNYFNRRIPLHFFKVRISLSVPPGVKPDGQWLSVAPDWEGLLKPYKEGLISDFEYTRRYLAYLDGNREKITEEFRQITAEHGTVVLLCWCGKGRFCHRRILADWLRQQGFDEIPEL